MEQIRITKIFRFEMAHALLHYDGLCRNIHGHSYELRVTLKGEPETDENSPKQGMLMDFSDLKRMVNEHIVNVYDHALVLHRDTDAALLEQLRKHYDKILLMPCQPTSEHLLLHFVKILKAHLPGQVGLYSLRLAETATSYAEWFAEDVR